jgi:hypothetical protein
MKLPKRKRTLAAKKKVQKIEEILDTDIEVLEEEMDNKYKK